MVEIKNNGTKIVHVGKVVILPGESAKVADKVAATPAIKILAKKNLLTLTEVKEDATTAASTDTTSSTSSKKKTTSKKTTATSTDKPE